MVEKVVAKIASPGPDAKRRQVQRLHVFRSKNHEWVWHLRSRNGKIIAVGGETFKGMSGALKGACVALGLVIPKPTGATFKEAMKTGGSFVYRVER